MNAPNTQVDPETVRQQQLVVARRQRDWMRRTLLQAVASTINPTDKKKGQLLFDRANDLEELLIPFSMDVNTFVPLVGALLTASKRTNGPISDYNDLLDLVRAASVFCGYTTVPGTDEPEEPGRDERQERRTDTQDLPKLPRRGQAPPENRRGNGSAVAAQARAGLDRLAPGRETLEDDEDGQDP